MIDKELVEKVVAYLNELLALDAAAISDLVDNRVSCNTALENHPSCQVAIDGCEGRQVGMLGVLNGLCGVFDSGERKGWGAIVAVIETDSGQPSISKFVVLTQKELT